MREHGLFVTARTPLHRGSVVDVCVLSVMLVVMLSQVGGQTGALVVGDAAAKAPGGWDDRR